MFLGPFLVFVGEEESGEQCHEKAGQDDVLQPVGLVLGRPEQDDVHRFQRDLGPVDVVRDAEDFGQVRGVAGSPGELGPVNMVLGEVALCTQENY